SAQVGDLPKCKRKKRRWMQSFVRNVKVLTGAEEVVCPISVPHCSGRSSGVGIDSNEKSIFG
ncbi:MAG: hypothetical protein WA324_25365, partial [Bryobacteraceae bacterium]